MCASVSKPWDSLRAPAKKAPICEGTFRTTPLSAKIRVSAISGSQCVLSIHDMYGGPGAQNFGAADLRELAGFATELADQLDCEC